MHWLIDAGAIKTGGGVQIALNRLPILTEKLIERGYKVTVLLPSVGLLSNLALANAVTIIKSPNEWWSRLFLEYIKLPRRVRSERINVVYTLFGFGIPHPKEALSIVNTGNATTCYPDSAYWKRLNSKELIIRKIYTHLRQTRLKKNDFYIFETEIMQKRSVRYIGLNKAHTAAINPSPTGFLQDRPARQYIVRDLTTITLLTGIERHKNLDCVLRICQNLMDKGVTNILFQISVTQDQLDEITPTDINLDNLKNIKCIGKIPQNNLQPIYDQSDIIMNVSELESFSNNYMEAWKAGIAQICSNRDFAHHICAESAAYIEPLNTEEATQEIIKIASNPELLTEMAKNGKLRLSALPSHELYVERTLELIDRVTLSKYHSDQCATQKKAQNLPEIEQPSTHLQKEHQIK